MQLLAFWEISQDADTGPQKDDDSRIAFIRDPRYVDLVAHTKERAAAQKAN